MKLMVGEVSKHHAMELNKSVNQLQRSHVKKYILSTVEARTLMKTAVVCVLVHTMMMLLNSLAKTGLIVLVDSGYMKSVLKIIELMIMERQIPFLLP